MATSITTFLSERSWQSIVSALGLSDREAQVARLILAHDESEAAIATRLDISPHTVHSHLERLYRKLGVTSRCQVVARMFEQYVALTDDGQRGIADRVSPSGAHAATHRGSRPRSRPYTSLV